MNDEDRDDGDGAEATDEDLARYLESRGPRIERTATTMWDPREVTPEGLDRPRAEKQAAGAKAKKPLRPKKPLTAAPAPPPKAERAARPKSRPATAERAPVAAPAAGGGRRSIAVTASVAAAAALVGVLAFPGASAYLGVRTENDDVSAPAAAPAASGPVLEPIVPLPDFVDQDEPAPEAAVRAGAGSVSPHASDGDPAPEGDVGVPETGAAAAEAPAPALPTPEPEAELPPPADAAPVPADTDRGHDRVAPEEELGLVAVPVPAERAAQPEAAAPVPDPVDAAPAPPAPEVTERKAVRPPPPPPARGLAAGRRFVVQIAALGDRTKAESVVRRLSDAGVPARVHRAAVGGKELSRIVIDVRDQDEAARTVAKVAGVTGIVAPPLLRPAP